MFTGRAAKKNIISGWQLLIINAGPQEDGGTEGCPRHGALQDVF